MREIVEWSGGAAGVEETLEPVRADDREERGTERHEQMRSQAGLALAQLALDTDHPAEHGRKREPQEGFVPVQCRERANRELQQPLPLA